MAKELEFNEEDQSEFNAAIATLQRIHEIKKWLAVATERDNLYSYYKYIKMFYKELVPMFKKEKKQQEKRWKDAKKLDFNSKDKKEVVLNFLEEWELELRQVEQDRGMNLPKKPDSRWALTRR